VTPQQKAELDRLTDAFEASGASHVTSRFVVPHVYNSPMEVVAAWNGHYSRSVLVLVDGTVL
jgi:hypothetical protein